MLPVHHLTVTKILKRARKIMRCLPDFLMREAMNAILGRFRLPAVAKITHGMTSQRITHEYNSQK